MSLLTITQQNSYKPLSQNWCNQVKIAGGKTNFALLQDEVENLELRKLLGGALLLDIQSNPTNADYLLLLDGATFEDCDGNNISFKGIRFELSYMNYSKYVGISGNADTFTGMVRQNRPETTFLSEGAIKREQIFAQEIALQDFEVMKLFLNDNTDTYALWNCGVSKKIFTPKLKTIRKTYS